MQIPSSQHINRKHAQPRRSSNVVFINGRRMYHDGSVKGSDLIQASGQQANRRTVIRSSLETRTIDPNHTYQADDLMDKYGRPVHIQDIPDRSKGDMRYGALRSDLIRPLWKVIHSR